MAYVEYVPYDKRGLGYAYNDCAACAPDGWIAFRDSDVMLLGNYGHLVEEVIEKHGDKYDLFTCKTNRIGIGPQRALKDRIDPCSDLKALYRMQQIAYKVYKTSVAPCSVPIAGYWLLFRKSLAQEIPFPLSSDDPGAVQAPTILGIDIGWSQALLKAGKRIGVINGLVAIHYYRLHCDTTSDCKHLNESGFIFTPS